jgi:hypothetical protein
MSAIVRYGLVGACRVRLDFPTGSSERPPWRAKIGGIIYDPSYLGIDRTEDIVLVQITLSAGRKPKQKRDFYARAAALLAQEPGLKPQDLFINLVEVVWENWSFGNGKSQYTE